MAGVGEGTMSQGRCQDQDRVLLSLKRGVCNGLVKTSRCDQRDVGQIEKLQPGEGWFHPRLRHKLEARLGPDCLLLLAWRTLLNPGPQGVVAGH